MRTRLLILPTLALGLAALVLAPPPAVAQDNYWHISTYYAANLNGHGEGNRAMWCGDSTLVRCAPVDSMGGVRNNMDELLTWSHAVADPSVATTVRITAWVNYDFPDITWDWLELYVMRAGADDKLVEYTGTEDNIFLDFSATIQPGEYGGTFGNEVRLKFRVFSDGAWSDEDCFMLSHGGAQIDDVSVYLDDQLVTFDDFEAGSPLNWVIGDFIGASDVPEAEVFAAYAAPNPFNPATRIVYNLPARARVEIRIYDTQGRLVRELLAAERAAGPGAVVWDGRDDAGGRVASGVYMYRVQAGDDTRLGKLALVK
jgi:hypothetical protein